MVRRFRSLVLIVEDVSQYMRDRHVTQAALAARSGVSQSQVSRLLSGKPRRLSKSVLAICRYAKIDASDLKASDPRRNGILMGALKKVWDGTDEHARSIARVIASLER